jgi:hypothetical protein
MEINNYKNPFYLPKLIKIKEDYDEEYLLNEIDKYEELLKILRTKLDCMILISQEKNGKSKNL